MVAPNLRRVPLWLTHQAVTAAEIIREIEALGYHPYGRRYEFTHAIPQILASYGAKTAEELTPEVRVRVAGRLMTLRHMGKAGFAHLQQNGERLQIYVKKDAVGERDHPALVGLQGKGDAGADEVVHGKPAIRG